MPSLQFRNMASASTAKETTKRRTAHKVKKRPVEANGVTVLRQPTHEEVSTGSAPCVRFGEVGCVEVEVHYHAGCAESKFGIGVSGEIVK